MADHNVTHEPGPEDIGFEHQDLRPRSILGFLLALGMACVVIYFVLMGVYAYLEKDYGKNQPPLNPLKTPAAPNTRIATPEEVASFPEPRLETNERLEIHDFRLEEEKRLNSYGWVDQSKGEVHIPIERAMQLIEQRGLPTAPASLGQRANASPAAPKNPGVSGQMGVRGATYPGTPQ